MKRFALMILLPAGLLPAVRAADPPAPAVTITLGARHGHATPTRHGFTHTGGGNVDVAQPAPDTVVVSMSGVAVAGGHPWKASTATVDFDLSQCFEVLFASPATKKAKLTLEARVIGLLRSHTKGGSAGHHPGCASVSVGTIEVLTLSVPEHGVSCRQNLSVNCREGPVEVPVTAGKYTLRQTFAVTASHPRTVVPCKAASAEIAPDPALDPLWISYWEPFHGAAKKDFGLQVTLKVIPE